MISQHNRMEDRKIRKIILQMKRKEQIIKTNFAQYLKLKIH